MVVEYGFIILRRKCPPPSSLEMAPQRPRTPKEGELVFDRPVVRQGDRESERASEREVSCDDGEVHGSKKNTTTNKETTESRRRAMVHLSAFRPHAPGGPRNVVHRPDPRFLQRFTRLEMGSFGCRWIPPAPSGVCATGATKRHGGWQVS